MIGPMPFAVIVSDFFLFSLFLWASLNRNWNNIDLTTEMRRHFKTILLYYEYSNQQGSSYTFDQ